MIGKKPIGVGLLVAVAAVLAMALMAPLASATEVLTPNVEYQAKLKTGTFARFKPQNAFNTVYVSCKAINKAKFKTPTAAAGALNNQNKTGTGTFSKGPGSVIMALETPEFSECGFFSEPTNDETEQGTLQLSATTTTSAGWSLAAEGQSATEGILAIGVPSKGAIVTGAAEKCTITVQPSNVGVVFARYTNSTHIAKVDGQVFFTAVGAACSGTSPAQFEATLSIAPVTAGSGEFEVKP